MVSSDTLIGHCHAFLLERLSRNLFAESHSDDTAMTAADAIGSALMGNATSIEAKTPFGYIALNAKGLKQAKKTAIDEDGE